jgi:hypothetical protein
MREVIPFPISKQPQSPAPSIVDAFWYLVRLGDPVRLKAWLQQHREDARALFNLLLADQ